MGHIEFGSKLQNLRPRSRSSERKRYLSHLNRDKLKYHSRFTSFDLWKKDRDVDEILKKGQKSRSRSRSSSRMKRYHNHHDRDKLRYHSEHGRDCREDWRKGDVAFIGLRGERKQPRHKNSGRYQYQDDYRKYQSNKR